MKNIASLIQWRFFFFCVDNKFNLKLFQWTYHHHCTWALPMQAHEKCSVRRGVGGSLSYVCVYIFWNSSLSLLLKKANLSCEPIHGLIRRREYEKFWNTPRCIKPCMGLICCLFLVILIVIGLKGWILLTLCHSAWLTTPSRAGAQFSKPRCNRKKIYSSFCGPMVSVHVIHITWVLLHFQGNFPSVLSFCMMWKGVLTTSWFIGVVATHIHQKIAYNLGSDHFGLCFAAIFSPLLCLLLLFFSSVISMFSVGLLPKRIECFIWFPCYAKKKRKSSASLFQFLQKPNSRIVHAV